MFKYFPWSRCQDEDDGPSFEPLDDLLPHGLAKKAWATSLDADDAAGAQRPGESRRGRDFEWFVRLSIIDNSDIY